MKSEAAHCIWEKDRESSIRNDGVNIFKHLQQGSWMKDLKKSQIIQLKKMKHNSTDSVHTSEMTGSAFSWCIKASESQMFTMTHN